MKSASKKLLHTAALCSMIAISSAVWGDRPINQVPSVFSELAGMKLKPTNARKDKELMQKKEAFDKALIKVHRKKQNLKKKIRRIKRKYGNSEKATQLINTAERQLMSDTFHEMEKARLPLVQHIVNKAQSSSITVKDKDGNLVDRGSIKSSDGTPMYIKDASGKLIPNPKSSGWLSDHDYSASESEAQRIAMISRDIGLDDQKYNKYLPKGKKEKPKGPLIDDKDSTTDVRILELTTNRNMQLYADVPGSEEHRAKVQAMASNVETFTSHSMSNDQPGKDAVFTHDLLNKAAETRKMDDPTRKKINDPQNRDAWERYNKSTKKMLEKAGKKFGGMGKDANPAQNAEVKEIIQKAIDKNPNLKNKTPEQIYNDIAKVKGRESAHFKDDQELKDTIKLQNDIQDEVIQKMENDAAQERKAMRDVLNLKHKKHADNITKIRELREKKAIGQTLHIDEYDRLAVLVNETQQIEQSINRDERKLTDSEVRHNIVARENAMEGVYDLNVLERSVDDGGYLPTKKSSGPDGEGGPDGGNGPDGGLQPSNTDGSDNTQLGDADSDTRSLNDPKLGDTKNFDGTSSSGNTGSTGARKKLNDIAGSGFDKAMKGMDAVDKLTKAYDATTKVGKELYEGNYGKAYENAKKMAMEELSDKAKEVIMERLIPGYGQLSGAYDIGYMVGEQIGKIPISADGKTINQVAENQFRQNLFSGQDNRSSEQERYNEITAALTRSVKAGDIALADGEQFSDILDTIRSNLIFGDSPLDGVDLQPGTKALAAMIPAPTEPELQDTVIEPGPMPEPEPKIDDPWAYDEESADDGGAPIQVIDSSVTESEKAAMRNELRDQAAFEEQQKQASMQDEFYEAEQVREEKARRDAQAKAEFAAGLQSLASGLQQVYTKVKEADAQSNAEIAAHNARMRSQVNAIIERNKGRPTSHDLVSGKATLEDYKAWQEERTPNNNQNTDPGWSFNANEARVNRDAARVKLTPRQMQGSVFDKMCNDLRSKGAELSDEQCRQMAKKTIGVSRNMMGAKSLDDFVKRFCGYAQTKKERDACKPKAKREFQKAIARNRGG